MLDGALRELQAQLVKLTEAQREEVTAGFVQLCTGLQKLGPIGLSGRTGMALMKAIGVAAAMNQSPGTFLRDAEPRAAKVGREIGLLVSTVKKATG